MNILDENILESQRELLRRWRVPFRQIGYEIGRKGMKDEQVLRLLLGLRQPTFFTLDSDFYERALCHTRYGKVYLDVQELEAARFVRRLLHYSGFDTHAKRMGVVIRASHTGLDIWQAGQLTHYEWLDRATQR